MKKNSINLVLMFFANIKKSEVELFREICSKHKLKNLYAFGSAIDPTKFSAVTSDIDLLVEMNTLDPLEKGELLLSFWDSVESFFKRKVDLITLNSLKNPFFKKAVDQTKILIYDGEKQEIFI